MAQGRYTPCIPAWTDANSTAALPETAISSPALAYNVAVVTLASH